jgi:protein O-GlcNAc transferase
MHRLEAPYLAREMRHVRDRSSRRRLRVGYVSPDFRNHCQSFFTMPLLRNHDHGDFEIFCYSSARNEDSISERLKQYVDVWVPSADLDDDALAQRIADDGIDILVDLTMHMSGGRPLLFARRPAPVQIAWLAYPGTTGSSAIGYRLTDPWLDPVDDANADTRYSERSIRLPHTFWCYDPLTDGPAVNDLPAKANGWVTFGCLNHPRKLTERTLRLWASVLRKVENSRFILLVTEGAARVAVLRRLEALGVDTSRVSFVGNQSRDAYLRTYRQIDIALDTFPYNGHTTSLDSFWMGVPVLTIIGQSPASRAGYALLMNLGLPGLVAGSDEEFVEIGTALAFDTAGLALLRSGLRERMQRSPLMDGTLFAKGMEEAYRRVWWDRLKTQD